MRATPAIMPLDRSDRSDSSVAPPAPVVDELQVHWADGSTSTYHQVPTNRTLTITAR